jgi:Arc/MetJ-type ribon-helix-helix transcriptional regulator
MVKVAAEIPGELARQIDRIIRDGWFPDQEAVVREALNQFVDAKSFLGDSPRMLHRFAADALNDSKPETALKFVNRALSLMTSQDATDFALYQSLVELRVQVLLVLGRPAEAIAALEEARERLPNNPTISKWLEKLNKP